MEILKQEEILKASEILKNGGVLAIPTETVYGLAVIYDEKSSFDALVKVKKRKPNKPFALACGSVEQALEYIEIDKKTKAVMDAFLPGELTILVNAKQNLPSHVTLGTNVIGIRIPNYPFVCDLIKEVGKPCLLTSANISDCPASRDYREVLGYFDNQIDGLVEGECHSLVPTTIVNLSIPGKISLVRQGALSYDEIKKIWEEAK